MNYNELYDDFINLFPEDASRFKRLEEEAGVVKSEDGIYVMYDMVVVPYVKDIVDEAPAKAKIAFDFFESMEKDENPEVGNVMEVSVLESLLTSDGGLNKYLPFIGEETLKAARYIAQFYDSKPF